MSDSKGVAHDHFSDGTVAGGAVHPGSAATPAARAHFIGAGAGAAAAVFGMSCGYHLTT